MHKKIISNLNYLYKNGSFSDLKKRFLFIVYAIFIFRIGSFIPIPGIDISSLTNFIDQKKGTIIEIFNMFSGGALSRASIFSLGVMPYISSSIIVQLLSVIHPKLSEIKKDGGEIGKRIINQYIRYGTLILSIFQSIGIILGLKGIIYITENDNNIFLYSKLYLYFISAVSLVGGTMFLMWLGEQITEKGIGNGISIIIFIGILSELPASFILTIEQVSKGDIHILLLIFILILIFVIIFFVVFIERGQRRIVVYYASRHQNRMIHYMSGSTHLPLKVNMSGVIPAIFSSSVILFPATIISFFDVSMFDNLQWLGNILSYFKFNKCSYLFIYSSLIVFFCFFYTSLVFNPKETADNLKKSGAFLPGIRPGEQTSIYIRKIMYRLTLISAIYITFICLIPEFMRSFMQVSFCFGGTSLLIVVMVIMDFILQLQTLMLSSQYESIFKKKKHFS